MAIFFKSRLTKSGNIKLSSQTLDILNAKTGDVLAVAVEVIKCKSAENNDKGNDNTNNDIRLPADVLAEAGISADATLEIYVDGDSVIIREADTDDC